MHTILALFGISQSPVRSVKRIDIAIPGSPERCIERSVWQGADGALWLLERLAESQVRRRETVGSLVSALALASAPYVRSFRHTDSGGHVLQHGNAWWQCSPFVTGMNLPRPAYIEDAWRGERIGSFIAGLQEAGRTLPSLPDAGTAPLPAYAASLTETIRLREPGVYARLAPMLPHFAPLFAILPMLPTAIAHGDCHPLNMIWGEHDINGVIDWEFAGEKPVIYDAANCIGCVGFEHPDWLVQGLVPALIRTLHERKVLTEEVMQWLLPFTCALRFAWLSEWLRRNDREMIDMELDYMDILIRHGKAIQSRWQAACV